MTISPSTVFVMVDDNEHELFLAQAIFRHSGATNEFIVERSADKVMPLLLDLRRRGVDSGRIVVLLDIRMPGMNGFELIYTMRNTIETHDVRIIMQSASRSPADHDNSAAIGADGYITKPFSYPKLEAALRTFEPA